MKRKIYPYPKGRAQLYTGQTPPGVLRSPRALAESSREKKCFLHHRGRCTSPAPLCGYPFARKTGKNGFDQPFFSVLPYMRHCHL